MNEKTILIKKEIKDSKLYLNELYNSLNKTNSSKEKKDLNLEINAVNNTKKVLSNLLKDYEQDNDDTKIEKLTITNDNELKKYINKYPEKEEIEDYLKITNLKSSLDLINEQYLSKEEIYEYLNDYNEVIKLARENINIPIIKVFNYYMDSNNKQDKNNIYYYYKMIKIHILFINLSILSITKDEDFEHLDANDPEMGEKTKNDELSFLKDKFIIPADSTRFKKTHIFNYIRNAFHHSDTNELYKISKDCNFITISLKQTNPIPFNVKVTANDILRMTRLIQNYSHGATLYELENQEQLDLDNVLDDHFHKCSRELDKLTLIKKILPKSIKYRKKEIHEDISTTPEAMFSPTVYEQTIKKYGTPIDLKYKFSKQQKRLFYNKFKYFDKYLSNIGMKYFVVPIIINYMPGGINKISFLYFDTSVSYTYLFNYNNSILDIINDISNDYTTLINNKDIQFNKPTIFNYIDKDVNISKYGLLYMFDEEERGNFNDILLLKYVFGTMYNEEKINIAGIDYPTDRIRNSLTHNRWRGYTNERKERCFYFYDDEFILVDPDNANQSKTFWSANFLYKDLKNTINDIVSNYNKQNNKNFKKSIVKVKNI